MLKVTKAQLNALAAQSRARTPARVLETLRSQGLEAWRDISTGDVLAKDARGHVSRFVFGTDGRLAEFRRPSGRALRFGYDHRGRLNAAEHPGGEVLRYEHDGLGRVSAFESVGHACYEFDYDERSRLTRVTHPDRRTELAEYDVAGSLLSLTDRSGARREITRQANREFQTDALGRRFCVRVDASGSLEGTDFPDGTHEDYEFDERSSIARITQRDGGAVDIAVDEQGSPTKLQWTDGSQVAFEYDGAGRVIAARNAASATALAYDADGQLTKESSPAGSVEFGYDPEGRLLQLTSPQGTVHYEYDADGRLATVIDWDGHRVRFNYGPGDWPTSVEYPNGTIEQFVQSRRPLAVQSRLRNASGRSLSAWAAEFDSGDRVVKFFDAWGSANEHQLRRAMSYDIAGRLVGEADLVSGDALNGFGYDAAGNMVRDGQESIAIGPLDQVIARGSTQVSYDALGNVSELDGPGGRMRCRFSADNRLQQVKVAGRTYSYTYDALCRRISKTDGQESWTYGWAGTCLLWEEHRPHPDAKPMRRDYLYAPVRLAPIGFREAGRMYWLQHDHRGAVVAVHDQAGELVWRGAYDGFGNVRVLVSGVRQPWRLAGQFEDTETGLYYNFARYYSPFLKSYLSLDPLCTDVQTSNYSYCNNDPWNYADGAGMLPQLVAALLIGAAVGAVVGGIASGYFSERPTLGGKLKDAAAGSVAGAVGGALAVVLIPSLGPVLGGAIIGAVEGGLQSILSNVFNGEKVDWECAAYSAGWGALAGAVTAGLMGIVGRQIAKRLVPRLAPLFKRFNDFVKKRVKDLYRPIPPPITPEIPPAPKQPRPKTPPSVEKPPNVVKSKAGYTYDMTPGDPAQPVRVGQKGVSPEFSKKGRFAGADIDDVVEKLKSGELTPEDVPVDYIWVNGEKVAVNNRSATTLSKAGIPQERWVTRDQTGKLPPAPDFDSLESVLERLDEMGGKPSNSMPVRATGDRDAPIKETVPISK